MTGRAPRPLGSPCGEQGKLLSAEEIHSCRKGTSTMSEQEKARNFMQELDLWSEANIIGPLFASETNPDEWESSVERVKKAIRTKVLESYRQRQ
jgi:hypothetical protein